MAKRQRFEKLKRQRQEIAAERIEILMAEADRKGAEHDFKYASRYATLARSIGMRYNVRPSKADKMRLCKKCGAYLRPGINLRVRLGKRTLSRTCLECGHVKRIPIRGKAKC